MLDKKKRRSIFNELFGSSAINEADFLKGLSTGYSVSITQSPQGTKVRARVGGDVNVNDVKKQLEKKYPNADIEIEGGKKEPLIREILTKTLKKNEKSKTE